MQMVTEEDDDLMLDADGQPTAGTDGQSELAEDDMCWLQDLKNEALTEEGELFYEDEEGNGKRLKPKTTTIWNTRRKSRSLTRGHSKEWAIRSLSTSMII